jgi:hypothetical protein
MIKVYVVEKTDFTSWCSNLRYVEYSDPKGYEGVKYIRAKDACETFIAEIHSAIVEPNDTIADIIKRAIGNSPRLYSTEEVKSELSIRTDEIDHLKRWASEDSYRSYRRIAHTNVDEEIFDTVSHHINSTPTLSLERYEKTEYGRRLIECDNDESVSKARIIDGEVLVLTRNSLKDIVNDSLSDLRERYSGGIAACMMMLRNAEDFFKQTTLPENDNDVSPSRRYFDKGTSKRPYIALLYTDEDPHIASYVRTHFDSLDKASGEACDVFFIENPSAVDPYTYWKDFLETKVYVVWKSHIIKPKPTE